MMILIKKIYTLMSVIENNYQYNKVGIADYHFEEISFKLWDDQVN